MNEFSKAFSKNFVKPFFYGIRMSCIEKFTPWEEFSNAVPKEKKQCCKISVKSREKLMHKCYALENSSHGMNFPMLQNIVKSDDFTENC